MTNENKNELLKLTIKDRINFFMELAQNSRIRAEEQDFESLRHFYNGKAEAFEVCSNHLKEVMSIIFGDEEHEEVDK